MHIPLPTHARTGLAAIGFRKPRLGETGPQPIWPVRGGSEPPADPNSGQPAPTPPPAQQPPATPPVPTPSQVFPPQQPAQAARTVGEHGFPENTPLAEMTTAEQAAYWRHQARKHENTAKARADYDDIKAKAAEYDKLQAANQTEMQRAVAEAEQRARADALAQAGAKVAESALRSSLKLAKGMDDAEIDRIVGPLNCTYFLAGDGLSVDTDKVTAYLGTIAAPAAPVVPAPAPAAPAAATPPAPAAPATGTPQPRPDMGQGNRTAPAQSGLAAGAEIAKARVAKRIAPPVIAK